MPTRRYYANAAPQQQLTGPITNSGTSLTVSGSFAGWPSSFPFFACLEYGTASMEIISVTNIVGTTATIVRGQDGTSGISHLGGATLDQVAIRQDFDEASAHTSANSGVHGAAGSVVGTSDSQTLTNKTLTSPTINTPAMSGGSSAGTISGTPTYSGALVFSGNPNFTGVPTFGGFTSSKYVGLPLFTNEAAATSGIGSPSTGMAVHLSAPTGGGPPGVYTWTSGAWTPPGATRNTGSLVQQLAFADYSSASMGNLDTISTAIPIPAWAQGGASTLQVSLQAHFTVITADGNFAFRLSTLDAGWTATPSMGSGNPVYGGPVGSFSISIDPSLHTTWTIPAGKTTLTVKVDGQRINGATAGLRAAVGNSKWSWTITL